MLRRSCLALVMEGVMYAPQGLTSLPILAQDMEPADFHFKCLPGFYDRTQASEPSRQGCSKPVYIGYRYRFGIYRFYIGYRIGK
jgi:hypothetical protein